MYECDVRCPAGLALSDSPGFSSFFFCACVCLLVLSYPVLVLAVACRIDRAKMPRGI